WLVYIVFRVSRSRRLKPLGKCSPNFFVHRRQRAPAAPADDSNWREIPMDNGVKGGAVEFEVLILGAGPAGLQLGHHLSRAGRSYLILEAGDRPGAFFQRFPRHRTLISSNKVYTGYDDPE